MREIFYLLNEDDTIRLGKILAKNLDSTEGCIYLFGELGVGKTTLVRAFLRAKGYDGLVKSPTYTIVETYQITDNIIHHFDLYRISDPEELSFIGIRDYGQDSINFYEWPQQGRGFIQLADLEIDIKLEDNKRLVGLKANTIKGKQWLNSIKTAWS